MQLAKCLSEEQVVSAECEVAAASEENDVARLSSLQEKSSLESSEHFINKLFFLN